jgi:hypothetical protein
MAQALLIIAYACLFLWCLRIIPFVTDSGIPRSTIGYLFVLKILAGTALWAIYTFYYPDRNTADIFKYFDDGAVMFSAFHTEPLAYLKMLTGIQNDTAYLTEQYYMVMNHWFREYETSFYNDSHTIIRFNAFVSLFSFGEFHVHTLFMSFLSTLGCVGLYRAFKPLLTTAHIGLVVACFLLPSILIWTSAPMKEGLLVTGLGLFLHYTMKSLHERFTVSSLIIIVLSAVLIFFQKFYVLASMLPGLFIYFWATKQERPSLMTKSLVVLTIFAVGVLLLGSFSTDMDILSMLARKQHDFINHGLATGSQSMLPVMTLDGSIRSFVSSAPYALYTSVLAPSIYLKGGWLGLVANVENLVILSSLLLALLHRRKSLSDFLPTILLCLLFVLILFLLIGWTTPVLGAMVRYRTPALPFILVTALLIADPEKLKSRFKATRFLFE